MSGHLGGARRGRRRFRGPAQPVQHGRALFWSSTSDLTGRKAIYCVFFLLGAILYALVPVAQHYRSVTLFGILTALIISMYGGGFATIPTYLRDLFGTMH